MWSFIVRNLDSVCYQTFAIVLCNLREILYCTVLTADRRRKSTNIESLHAV